MLVHCCDGVGGKSANGSGHNISCFPKEAAVIMTKKTGDDHQFIQNVMRLP